VPRPGYVDDGEWHDPRDFENYVSPTVQVSCARTALHIALEKKSERAVKMLLVGGAKKDIPWKHGEETKDTMELAKEKDMLKAMDVTWSTKNHRLYPKKVRDAIFMTLLVAKRQKWKLNTDCMFEIFTKISEI